MPNRPDPKDTVCSKLLLVHPEVTGTTEGGKIPPEVETTELYRGRCQGTAVPALDSAAQKPDRSNDKTVVMPGRQQKAPPANPKENPWRFLAQMAAAMLLALSLFANFVLYDRLGRSEDTLVAVRDVNTDLRKQIGGFQATIARKNALLEHWNSGATVCNDQSERIEDLNAFNSGLIAWHEEILDRCDKPEVITAYEVVYLNAPRDGYLDGCWQDKKWIAKQMDEAKPERRLQIMSSLLGRK
jgi:hypothetical protein